MDLFHWIMDYGFCLYCFTFWITLDLSMKYLKRVKVGKKLSKTLVTWKFWSQCYLGCSKTS